MSKKPADKKDDKKTEAEGKSSNPNSFKNKISNFLRSFISKISTHKSVILHLVLVILLCFGIIWQVLNFYSFSTHFNQTNAVKTNHMVIYDIKTGKDLASLSKLGAQEKVESTENLHHPEPIKTNGPPPEIALVITGLGTDSALTTEAENLGTEFIYSYSPYAAGALEESMKKAATNALIMADINIGGTKKFDINERNSNYRNIKNAEAGVSKIFDASAIFLVTSEGYTNTEFFANLADAFEGKEMKIVTSSAYHGDRTNVISADVYLPSGSSPEQINAELARLEEIAKTDGFAVGVIEAQTGAADLLKAWVASAKSKKFKFISELKN